MNIHPTIANYIAACNARDTSDLVACFTPDATVIDEGKTHQGHEEIRAWADHSQASYSFTMVATKVEQKGEATEVTCMVSGDFDGSPIDLKFLFSLSGDKITSLKID